MIQQEVLMIIKKRSIFLWELLGSLEPQKGAGKLHFFLVSGRLNLLEFGTTDGPRDLGTMIRWDSRIRRYAVRVGYKISQTVLLKAGYAWTLVDTDPWPYLDVWGGQVSAVL